MNSPSMGHRGQICGIHANEGVNPEKPSRAGIQTGCYAVCDGGRDDVWVLEGWEGNSGTEVRPRTPFSPETLEGRRAWVISLMMA